MPSKKSRIFVPALLLVLVICFVIAAMQFKRARAYPDLMAVSARVALLQAGSNGSRIAWLSDHELLIVSLLSQKPVQMHLSVYDTGTRQMHDLNELNSALRNAPAGFQDSPVEFTESPDKRWLIWSTGLENRISAGKLLAAKMDGTVIKEIKCPVAHQAMGNKWLVIRWEGPTTLAAHLGFLPRGVIRGPLRRCSVNVETGDVVLADALDPRPAEGSLKISMSTNLPDKIHIAADWPAHPLYDATMGIDRNAPLQATGFEYPALNSSDTQLIYASGCPEVQSAVVTTREKNSGELSKVSSRLGTPLSPPQDAYVRVTALDLKHGVTIPVGQLQDTAGANQGTSSVLMQLGLVVASPGCKNVYFVYNNALYVTPIVR